ncbi:MAG TPA: response regulator transcription factor [Bacteroidia bacterium]|nr:response regulator transcription factor [Bacteroidia bacterium]
MVPHKILVVEDEPKVAAFIKKGLEESQFEVELALDGKTGRDKAMQNSYAAIVLDINLPEVNGYELCKAIRLKKPEMPILILSALGSIDEKLTGFELGADDYLAKPFEFSELVARLKALLKRASANKSSGKILRIADLEINTDLKEVKRGGKKIELTAKEFLLLEFLVRNSNKVISRSEIAEKIWEINFDTGTNVIDVYINFLRKKIDKDFSKKLIHTQIGMGYVLKEEA